MKHEMIPSLCDIGSCFCINIIIINGTNNKKLLIKPEELKVALGVCFVLKFEERRFTSFHKFNYLM